MTAGASINDAERLTRQIMGNIPGWLATAFYLSAFAACGWTAWRFSQRVRRYRRGRREAAAVAPRAPADEATTLWPIISKALTKLPFHQKLLLDPYAGIAHVLVFYGFLVLFAGTCLVFLEHDTPLHFFYGRFYLVASLVVDLGGVAFVVGLLMFLLRRHVRLTARILHRQDVATLAWLLLAIAATGFVLEGARIAIDLPTFERWSVIGYAIAGGLRQLGFRGEAAVHLHRWVWGGHAALCVGFFALLSWGFFTHMLAGPASWALRSDRKGAALRPVFLASDGNAPPPGASRWTDMSWRDLLQADACTTCGRCNAVCPAAAAGKPLQPRNVVLALRAACEAGEVSDGVDQRENFAARVNPAAIWSCTTCSACNEACPVGIEVFDKIVDLRRGRVEAGDVPTTAANRFQNLIEEFTPFPAAGADRLQWAAGLDVPVAQPDEPVELLFWVGCAGAYDPEGRTVSRAMIKVLNHLGVKYRVLGNRERCTGDAARRMGEEGLAQELVCSNSDALSRHQVKRIVTHCPHCYNAFRNEYPQANPAVEVEHHSEFLARMIGAGKLALPAELQRRITFHDPCYLGRGNGQVATPRSVLDALPAVERVEMPQHGRQSFCCGAGGGSLWLDVKGADRIENQRAAEAAATGADVVVTGCPFCKGMLKAGGQSLANAPEVKDLVELVVHAAGL